MERTATSLVVDVQGVGYELRVSTHTTSHTRERQKVALWTFFHVTDNAQTLYGFHEREERDMFCLLLSVTGLGPSTAIAMLSVARATAIEKSILVEDLSFLQSIRGVGKKTAQRIVLELKDKIQKGSGASDMVPGTARQEEAIAALGTLGFSRTESRKHVQRALSSEGDDAGTLEDLIRAALKQA